MRAMSLRKIGGPLELIDCPAARPGTGELRLQVEACGVCRTDLHVVDGELTGGKLPLIPGHEIVGRVVELGPGGSRFSLGQRVGIPWLGHSCGRCRYCEAGQENLCDTPGFTGYTLDGGYAEHCVASQDYAFALPEEPDPVSLAPLLCAGLIGYRSYRMAGEAPRLGLYGFGAAAHILTQLACWQGRDIYAFTRPGDTVAQAFARETGAAWAGGSDQAPPVELDAAILFAPVGALVPMALRAVRKGGVVVCGGIHMSDIPRFPYADLWGERVIRSVANLTREDGEQFLRLASQAGIEVATRTYRLDEANEALDDLRAGRLTGAAVLVP
ncbi:zinc-dependent alcohol dehydrogenase family protein [Alloalcanivorax xenomutans]|uniref:zinc-dependent alcohol dehydrogenase family protein n=1 Tax=Alloalcanivorax xenomutans TaxID=1094342 RepID=UPI0003B7E956|nr:zinc-dependent alcohol dehydrogenase family protein [Alloalcanivorax xenomutans]ERS15080.1 alcohol dehydrogenase [Alcanivorax sp. PN-3]MBA4721609.1 zinc-dependent alcohol dehydrogenase family protein [Alcanivorax sp.]PHS72085.1 MAG: zinc-binding alcohol dehydrogenase family protein [Alcanivorax sp.]CUR48338.1 Alcohol dehydrogenase [Alloalcanivorax xenomutans]